MTREQRIGTYIFLTLCLLCLAAAIWRSHTPPDPQPSPAEEQALIRRLNALQAAPDTARMHAQGSRPVSNKSAHKSAATKKSTQSKKQPAATPAQSSRPYATDDIPTH